MAKRPPSLTGKRITARSFAKSRRASRHARGYGTAWDKRRAALLRAEPFCRACKLVGRVTPATDVDHIVPRSQGGGEQWANLQPLCGPCHDRKTAGEGQARRW